MRSLVEQHRIVAILRGVPVRQAPTLAEHLYRAGIRLLEVSFSDEQGPEVLDILHGALDGALLLGAGTVTTLERATAARQAGARFVLTPHLVPEVNAYAVSHGLGLISGAMTPSEVQTARQQGSEVVKLFPAGDLGSGYLRSLLGPYPDLSVLVVGNIGQHNLGEFIRAGALGAGIGSYLTRTDWNTPDYGELARRAPHLLAAFDSGGR
ncbi:bifunctional 4-hydroxy-2-oxoglutarate aldolase/2-dehydro-3-deoxy-phosphogluconate aldolase [Deinococcus sp.]|uniref:bifunctional 4-hydroxy-2-oxoglutarate aldolase/2-dehydro-3-deoxy-phosphogluconate aldolase n=1 Tax=Deinococcus sp. TaxID=47478 RepID=UPI003CC614A2